MKVVDAVCAISLAFGLGGCHGCFVGGTRVLTPSGPKAIEDLNAGDEVWSWSFVHEKRVRARVSATHRAIANRVLRLRAGAIVLSGVSDSHPFWCPMVRAWRAAGCLSVGEVLEASVAEDVNQSIAIDEIALIAGKVAVFNLTVDGEQNFFAEGLMVHNKSTPGTTSQSVLTSDEDEDGDGSAYWLDCDDSDPSVNHNAVEVCDDEADNDCDTYIDENDDDCTV